MKKTLFALAAIVLLSLSVERLWAAVSSKENPPDPQHDIGRYRKAVQEELTRLETEFDELKRQDIPYRSIPGFLLSNDLESTVSEVRERLKQLEPNHFKERQAEIDAHLARLSSGIAELPNSLAYLKTVEMN